MPPKNKFTKEERKSGPVNFVMGLAFITEGAIHMQQQIRSASCHPVWLVQR